MYLIMFFRVFGSPTLRVDVYYWILYIYQKIHLFFFLILHIYPKVGLASIGWDRFSKKTDAKTDQICFLKSKIEFLES